MDFELNIGMHITGKDNTPEEVMRRVEFLRQHLVNPDEVGFRVSTQGEEPTVILAGASSPSGVKTYAQLLAGIFRQEAVAVYFPATEIGYLVGPKADEWGPFDINLFQRY